MKTYIIMLLFSHAPKYDIDPTLAMAVVQHESAFNPKAVGSIGERGLFQVRPEYSKYSAEELMRPEINIPEGLRILAEAKKRCRHKENKRFLVCYNAGIVGGGRVKYPEKFPYYKKVYAYYEEIRRNQ